jgi:hypothetical protein
VDVSTLRSALILPGRSAQAYRRRDLRKSGTRGLLLPVVAQSIPVLLPSTVTWTNSSARSNPASLEGDAAPKNVPKCGQNAAIAYVRSTVLTDRPASVRQCVDFSAHYIDHALASALLLDPSSQQVQDSIVRIHRLREEQEVVTSEKDLSKKDELWQSLQLPHTPSLYCYARIFGRSRRALAVSWG